MALAARGLAAAFRFLPKAWGAAWAAIILLVGAQAALAAPLPRLPTLLAIGLVGVAAEGALWRMALGKPGRGLGGLQWGKVELRFLAVATLRAAFLGILAALLFVAVFIFAYAAAASGHGFRSDDVATWAPAVDERGRVLVTAFAAAGLVAFAWVAARIAIAEAASASTETVRLLSVWPQTRGMGSPILVAGAVLAAPPIALWLGMRALTGAAHPPLWAAALTGIVVAGQWLPMNVGLMAYAYDNRAVLDA